MNSEIPVILFAYARPDHLARVLRCLREEDVPLIYAYSDGPKGTKDASAVEQVRDLLRGIDWCEIGLVEHEKNMGLGVNVLAGITEVATRHEAFIVWEDDLVCVPGTYRWLCEALSRYSDSARVMSVTAWTHPRVTPSNVGCSPYFDGRAECWVWGAYARSWSGMNESIETKLAALDARGIDVSGYGTDVPLMASEAARRNTWAVRWLLHHFQNSGLCIRPPWSMVEHIGFDASATNAKGATEWANPPLRPPPPLPVVWPEAIENPDCRELWRQTTPGILLRVIRRLLRIARRK
jgi:hypothetical protein